jgi:hypothetical protein
MATGMLAEIGVRLRWVLGGPRAEGGASKAGCTSRADREIVIRLATDTPNDVHRGALAYALPYAQAGVVVTIFCDRVLETAGGENSLGAALLAHTLAHELAHVLQGVVRHSDRGVMKAHFTAEDLRQMKLKALPFTPLDAALIRPALGSRVCETKVTLDNDIAR